MPAVVSQMVDDASSTRSCTRCHREKPLDAKNWKGKMGASGFSVTGACRACADKDKNKLREKRAADGGRDKENGSGKKKRGSGGEDAEVSEFIGMSPLEPDAFSKLLSEAGDIRLISAIVDASEMSVEDAKERSDLVAKLVIGLWVSSFRYFNPYKYSGEGGYVRRTYHCAQDEAHQAASQKNSERAKQRDKGKMNAFPCRSLLYIWASPDDPLIFVSLRHEICHIKYPTIDLPEDVKTYVEANPNMTVPQIWNEILKTHPTPSFNQKAVYNLHIKQHQSRWHKDEDEFKSAKLLIESFGLGSANELEAIKLPDSEDGCTAIAFALPTLARKWGASIREAGLDSTCTFPLYLFLSVLTAEVKTTHSGYECYALLGEVSGSGVPLGFLLIKTKNPDANAKEAYIRSLIRHLHQKYVREIQQCLSDKDITEINVFLAELPPSVKYQLCFWHCIRIVKGRLCVLARRPALYDADAAFREFDWIDRTFVPVAQMDPADRNPERLQVAQSAIPIFKIHFNGKPVASAPARPKVVIKVNGKSRSAGDTDLDRLLDSLDDDELNEFLDGIDFEDRDGIDRFDGPDSWFEPGETAFAEDKTYVFCPAPHRAQLLHMFIRHLCEHPLLPDRLGATRSSAQIRRDAVYEMYLFCHQRGLREVWGYMWSAWYCAEKWKLWARSSEPTRIGRWRTTMAVENFWRNLKHDTLHHLAHPRLDQLVYLIATQVLPRAEEKMQKFDPEYRLGRSHALTPLQTAIKTEFKRLAKRKIGTHEYTVDVSRWICNCGQQKYSAYLLCKHLVQALKDVDPNFFRQAIRRRVIPFYTHPSFRLKDGSYVLEAVLEESIANGDRLALTSTQTSAGTKRKAPVADSSPAPAPTTNSEEMADEQMVTEELLAAPSRSSSPIRPDESDDEEMDDIREWMEQRVAEGRAAIDKMEEQLRHGKKAKIWLRAQKNTNLGGDLVQMYRDVRSATETGHIRPTTNASKARNGGMTGRSGSRSQRFARNTLGLGGWAADQADVAKAQDLSDAVAESYDVSGRDCGEPRREQVQLQPYNPLLSRSLVTIRRIGTAAQSVEPLRPFAWPTSSSWGRRHIHSTVRRRMPWRQLRPAVADTVAGTVLPSVLANNASLLARGPPQAIDGNTRFGANGRSGKAAATNPSSVQWNSGRTIPYDCRHAASVVVDETGCEMDEEAHRHMVVSFRGQSVASLDNDAPCRVALHVPNLTRPLSEAESGYEEEPGFVATDWHIAPQLVMLVRRSLPAAGDPVVMPSYPLTPVQDYDAVAVAASTTSRLLVIRFPSLQRQPGTLSAPRTFVYPPPGHDDIGCGCLFRGLEGFPSPWSPFAVLDCGARGRASTEEEESTIVVARNTLIYGSMFGQMARLYTPLAYITIHTRPPALPSTSPPSS
uniref:SWIM-type domain-containing protein n=1 Tax=Mycena chlorophos TaxID=658473 RepID=A0ABQ0LTQ7_MYCCL|nr:predicted protein [Mycena chlorophos]